MLRLTALRVQHTMNLMKHFIVFYTNVRLLKVKGTTMALSKKKKGLRKAIMKRSRLKNLFNKQRTHKNWVNYKMQQNHCVNLLRKTEKNYFTNLNIKNINDSKTFWKTIKPNFNEVDSSSSKVTIL